MTWGWCQPRQLQPMTSPGHDDDAFPIILLKPCLFLNEPTYITTVIEFSLIQYRYIIGIKNDTKNNLHYLDGRQLVFPAGSNMVQYSLETKKQILSSILDVHTLVSMTCSESGIGALVMRSEPFDPVSQSLSILIMDLNTLKKKKLIKPTGDLALKVHLFH